MLHNACRRNGSTALLWTLSSALALCTATTSGQAQLVNNPVERFEFVSWTDKPADLINTFGYTWFRSGRLTPPWVDVPQNDSLMSFTGRDTAFGSQVALFFNFTRDDSVLVALTLICVPPSTKGDVNDLLDDCEAVIQESYGEPQSSITIPFITKTLVWEMQRSTVRLVRTRTMMDALAVIYKPKSLSQGR